MQKVTEILELTFGKKVRKEGKTLKVNVDKLDGLAVYNLNNFNLERFSDEVKDFEVKRSGTGLVIIVDLK